MSIPTIPSTGQLQNTTAPDVASQQTIQDKLNTWVQQASRGFGENREIAANRILDAYKNKHDSLDLSKLNLISLPEDVLSELTDLETLNLSDNRLTIDAFQKDMFAGLDRLSSLNLDETPLAHKISLEEEEVKQFSEELGIKNAVSISLCYTEYGDPEYWHDGTELTGGSIHLIEPSNASVNQIPAQDTNTSPLLRNKT